jgi:hypothetical protein
MDFLKRNTKLGEKPLKFKCRKLLISNSFQSNNRLYYNRFWEAIQLVDQMTYEIYKDDLLKEKGHTGDYHVQTKMIKNLDRTIDTKNIVHFYPQYSYVKDKPTTLYLFMDKKVLKVSNNDKKIRIDMFDYKDITEINVETDDYYGNDRRILNVKFSNGEHIYLNSIEDTYDDWEDEFDDKIIMIFNYLLTK